mgnify:CR=1 FL=1
MDNLPKMSWCFWQKFRIHSLSIMSIGGRKNKSWCHWYFKRLSLQFHFKSSNWFILCLNMSFLRKRSCLYFTTAVPGSDIRCERRFDELEKCKVNVLEASLIILVALCVYVVLKWLKVALNQMLNLNVHKLISMFNSYKLSTVWCTILNSFHTTFCIKIWFHFI